jgi:hypothetical protein
LYIQEMNVLIISAIFSKYFFFFYYKI